MSESAFVVMQVGPKDSVERRRADEVFEFIVKRALADVGLQAYRADLDRTPGSITPKLLKELIESRLVVADLTGRNPNVYYELGVAHSFARPLICLAESADSLPFDTKDERVISVGSYSEEVGLSYAQGETTRQELTETLRLVMADGYVPASPVKEAAGSQRLDQLAPTDPIAAELAQIRESVAALHSAQRQPIPGNGASNRDVQRFRTVIEALVAAEVLKPFHVRSLIGTETTADHDQWVATLTSGMAAEDGLVASASEKLLRDLGSRRGLSGA